MWTNWPPESVAFPLAGIDLRVRPGPHPILAAHAEAIALNWQAELAANPALFDGKMVLQHRTVFDEGTIRGEGYLAPFSAFLWWRKTRPPGAAVHLAAMPVLEGCDGAVIAVRMSARTANPGKVYFAAGSLDESDIVDGVCDVDANMRREVLEETGIDLAGATSVGGFHALHQNGVITLFRRFRFAAPAATLAERIAAFVKTEAEPEIDGPVIIRDADPAAHAYQGFMPVILRHVFAPRD